MCPVPFLGSVFGFIRVGMERCDERTRHFPTMAGAAFEQLRKRSFDSVQIL
jgi:hypothetical protein